MDIYILNESFETIDMFDSYVSLVWTDRFNGYGDFEILTDANDENLKRFKPDLYLTISESKSVMIIETIKLTTDVEDSAKLLITGRSIESILDRRIIWGQRILQDSLQDSVLELIYYNAIGPEKEERKIDNLFFRMSTDDRITKLTMNAQYNGENLYDAVYGICQNYGIGFKIELNESNQFEFILYLGTDRSYGQNENPVCLFSPEFDNLQTSEYIETVSSHKNVALVGGAGEGDSQISTIVYTGGQHFGLDRREMYVDCSDLSTEVSGGGSIDKDIYLDQLFEKGLIELYNNKSTTLFDGELANTEQYKYGIDFFIGDIVQVSDGYGHEGKAIITEYIISHDNNGIKMYPTFDILGG